MICKEDDILIAKNLIEIFKNRNNVHRIVGTIILILGAGWYISILYTFTGWYNKNNACTKKIGVIYFQYIGTFHPKPII